MQECELGDSQSSNTSVDVSGMFLDILTHARSCALSQDDSDPVCLPSARSYKDVIDENLRLHSTVLNIKLENEKLLFVKTKQAEELCELKSILVAKKAKYKIAVSERDSRISDLQKRLEEDLLSVSQKYQSSRKSDTDISQTRISELENQLDTLRHQLCASNQDCDATRSELAKSNDLVSSTQEQLSQLRLDNTNLRERLSMFGIQAPGVIQPANEPRPILLLSKFNQLHHN